MHHFAMAMGALDQLEVSNRNSWRFLAGVHGCDADSWVSAGVVSSADEIPNEIKRTDGPYGRQCQHGSWHFLSWHRGYLFAFEAIVAAKVRELTGEDWALPYWNYLDEENPNARKVPDALLAPLQPDGTPNPLIRYRNTSVNELPSPPTGGINLEAMTEDDFLVGGDGTIGFGGYIVDGFAHFDRWPGDLEFNPHNTVHRQIGGAMADPNFAALDPIFWMHHCNIDRLWEAWMQTPGKTMVSDPRWLEGPFDRTFLMPKVGGDDPGESFVARDTLAGGKFHPSYDNLTRGTGVTPGVVDVARVNMGPASRQKVDPIGDNGAELTLADASVGTQVSLNPAATRDAVRTMGAAQPGEDVSRVYVALEGVRGKDPSPAIGVYLGLGEDEKPEDHPEAFAGELVFFGLNVASDPEGVEAGNGLSGRLDVTDLVQRLQAGGGLDSDRVSVKLLREAGDNDPQPIQIRAVVFYRRSGVVG